MSQNVHSQYKRANVTPAQTQTSHTHAHKHHTPHANASSKGLELFQIRLSLVFLAILSLATLTDAVGRAQIQVPRRQPVQSGTNVVIKCHIDYPNQAGPYQPTASTDTCMSTNSFSAAINSHERCPSAMESGAKCKNCDVLLWWLLLLPRILLLIIRFHP